MSPRWLHWPATTSAAPDYKINAELLSTAFSNQYDFTSVVESGNTDDFGPHGVRPLRYIESTPDSIQILLTETGALTASNISSAILINETDSIQFVPSSISFSDISGTPNLLRITLNGDNGSPDSALTFANTLAAGHEISLELFYV